MSSIFVVSGFLYFTEDTLLVVNTQLYKRLCLSIGSSVPWSMVIKLKRGKTSIINTFYVCLCAGMGTWGVDRGWMPLPISPQKYCDPVSLVR